MKSRAPNFPLRSAKILFILFFLLSLTTSAPQPLQKAAYIVQATNAQIAANLVIQSGGEVTSRLDIIGGVGARLTPAAAQILSVDPQVRSVIPDPKVRLADKGGGDSTTAAADYGEVVGADVVWDADVIGSGVTVAVVDTGLGKHQGVDRAISGSKAGRVLDWVDFVDGHPTYYDPNGHGTHVAGIIANSQVGSDGHWNGIAPGVSLVGVRVLNEVGEGTYESVIQGIQWVIDHQDQYDIRVMNLSLVSEAQSPYWADPLNQAVMSAWARGITVVAAAGNAGPGPMTIGVPGNNPYVISVGAFTDNYTPLDWNDDYLTPFSAAGPTLDGFVKPDLIAPGAHMVSSMLNSTELAKDHEASRIGNQYFSMAGTSQATAVVSGVAALILSQNPDLTPSEVKYRLMYTANPWVDLTTTDALYSMWQQGAGRVNAPVAVFGEITGSANQGMDIQADLAGAKHYEGYSYYDQASGEFRLLGDFSDWTGGYGNWSGGYGNWSGGYGNWSGSYGNWSGGYGNWSGGYGNWSGGYGNWSGGYGNWSGGYGNWSGGYGNWSGGYGNWSGGYGNWSGSVPWSGTSISTPSFVADFLSGDAPEIMQVTNWSGAWISEP